MTPRTPSSGKAGKLNTGFTIVNDISEFKPSSAEAAEHIKRAQGATFQKGVKRVIRIVGSALVSKMQFSRTQKEANVTYGTVEVGTAEEAQKLLDSKHCTARRQTVYRSVRAHIISVFRSLSSGTGKKTGGETAGPAVGRGKTPLWRHSRLDKPQRKRVCRQKSSRRRAARQTPDRIPPPSCSHQPAKKP
ncbi:MAG: hypothetical protein JW781_06055 [Deltaproteobacteria bacterium]|nr:hypothetical protein [Candidatus Anaeroferrophillacea bacterium]